MCSVQTTTLLVTLLLVRLCTGNSVWTRCSADTAPPPCPSDADRAVGSLLCRLRGHVMFISPAATRNALQGTKSRRDVNRTLV